MGLVLGVSVTPLVQSPALSREISHR